MDLTSVAQRDPIIGADRDNIGASRNRARDEVSWVGRRPAIDDVEAEFGQHLVDEHLAVLVDIAGADADYEAAGA